MKHVSVKNMQYVFTALHILKFSHYLQHSCSWLHHNRLPIHKHLQEVTGCCCCCCSGCRANFGHTQNILLHNIPI